MFDGSISIARRRGALLVAIMTCAALVVGFSPSRASAGTPKPTFIGPVLTADESPTISWGRDGGISVPLPGGRDLWIFADTPRYQYMQGKWKLSGFVYGSSAAELGYTQGHRLAGPLYEIVPGHRPSPRNQAAQLIPSPRLYLPDGSGRACNKANGGYAAAAVRWATGAALLPDQTNVLISFLDVCVTSPSVYAAQGWGFTEFNWKTNRLSVAPVDVIPPSKSGAEIPSSHYFGSPVIQGNKVTFFSETCCSRGSAILRTTLPATTAALRNRASYAPKPISGLPATFALSVVPPSRFSSRFLMYWMSGLKGQYRIYTAPEPWGPWTRKASGSLPRCGSNPYSCRNSVNMHPELSSSSQLLVSYYFPGYGPGIATKHPYPHLPLGHVVWATIPI